MTQPGSQMDVLDEKALAEAMEAALSAKIMDVIPIDDYLNYNAADAVELGVKLAHGDRFHGISDIRSDERQDTNHAILLPVVSAAIRAYLRVSSKPSGDLVERLRREAGAFRVPGTDLYPDEANAGTARLLDEAASALEQSSVKVGWRDISSAPKDGTLLLAASAITGARYVVGYHAAVGESEAHWSDVGAKPVAPALYFNLRYFTHWQPLPLPPGEPT